MNSASSLKAPGLTADWLNGWLAAIGATVLVPGLTLAWSDDVVPGAMFGWARPGDIVEAIADALPTEASLDASVIARTKEGCLTFDRTVTIEAYRERASIERAIHSTDLAASVSDLQGDMDPSGLDHGAFDVSAPHGETLWSRARSCAAAVPAAERVGRVLDSLSGWSRRVQMNGLGFDARRLPSSVQGSGKASRVFADPVIELLCFSALAIFPTRGDGRRIRQRRWTERATQRGAFTWPAWRPYMDRWAIDAFLDSDRAMRDAIVARYSLVPYRPRGDEMNRAYFSERVT